MRMTLQAFEKHKLEQEFEEKIKLIIGYGLKLAFLLFFAYGISFFGRLKTRSLSESTVKYALAYNAAASLFLFTAAMQNKHFKFRNFFMVLGLSCTVAVFGCFLMNRVPGRYELLILMMSTTIVVMVLGSMQLSHWWSLRNIPTNDTMVNVQMRERTAHDDMTIEIPDLELGEDNMET